MWFGLVAPIDTGLIAENLYAIKTGIVNFYIYTKGADVVALDSGTKEHIIKRELAAVGIKPEDISAIFLSHSDFDHVGGLPLFRDASVYISHEEEPLITGKTARKFGCIHNKKINKPYSLLKEGDIVSVGSITVKAIETPGHTPGSMSYIIDDKILYVGDTFTFRKGRVYPVAGFLNMDKRKLNESLRKLGKLSDIRFALTGHRGYTDEFSKAIECWR